MMVLVLIVVCFLKEIPLMSRKELYHQMMREAAARSAEQAAPPAEPIAQPAE